MSSLKNLLTIDIEEWYNFIGDKGAPSFEEWSKCESRVEMLTEKILEILEGYSVTFFILGFIGRQHPQLVKRIHNAGHEIACHGEKHDFVFDLSRQQFREDISRAKKLLEDITGQPCLGYRAPAFSIKKSNLWALEIIREEGFLYDASIFPAVRTAGGGSTRFFKYPHILKLKAGNLVEFPVSSTRLFGVQTVFCGGGFFRFFPRSYIYRNIERINNKDKQPVVIYLHPRDIDPHQPRMKLKPMNRFLYYYGLKEGEAKFRHLVNRYKWWGMGDFAKPYIHGIKSDLPVIEIEKV